MSLLIIYELEFGAAENVNESILNKYYNFAGTGDFASIGTMNNEEPTFAQDVESLGYVLLHGLNGGWISWGPAYPVLNHIENIAKKTELDFDANLKRLKAGDEAINIAKRDIGKYFELVHEHIKTKPKELLDYEALKACFNMNQKNEK